MINPRITDFHGIHKSQAEIDFAIQSFDEDLPLYVDPFLLWKSPSLQDQALHTSITNSFNHLNYLVKNGKADDATSVLIELSECEEVGLGHSKSRQGQKISKIQANTIIELFAKIPEISKNGFSHFEAIQLFVDGISKDRISDFSCNYIKSFLIDYTIDQCDTLKIPMADVCLSALYNYRKNAVEWNIRVRLPVNPTTNKLS